MAFLKTDVIRSSDHTSKPSALSNLNIFSPGKLTLFQFT